MEIKEYIKESIVAKELILSDENFINNIKNVSGTIIDALKNNKKVLIMGNGGSAADSNHIAAEFVSKFATDRKPLRAISLCANQSIITAIANDYSFDEIFSRQIEALGENDDIVIGISTSGKSQNIIKGFNKAREMKLKTIFLTGQNAEYDTDYMLKVPSNKTPIIQEAHIMIAHIICAIIEETLFKKV